MRFLHIFASYSSCVQNQNLINGINRKEAIAFAEAYLMFRKDFVYYADRLFGGSEVEGEDVIQDIFVYIWEKRDARFEDINGFKAYIYAAIRNKLKNSARHSLHVERHRSFFSAESSAVADMAETEVFSTLSRSETLLPAECARVFRMHMEGWSVKEIAEKLDKSENTVYHQRAEAINILRKKLSESDFGVIALLLLFRDTL